MKKGLTPWRGTTKRIAQWRVHANGRCRVRANHHQHVGSINCNWHAKSPLRNASPVLENDWWPVVDCIYVDCVFPRQILVTRYIIREKYDVPQESCTGHRGIESGLRGILWQFSSRLRSGRDSCRFGVISRAGLGKIRRGLTSFLPRWLKISQSNRAACARVHVQWLSSKSRDAGAISRARSTENESAVDNSGPGSSVVNR